MTQPVSPAIRPARPSDLKAIQDLLAYYHLPHNDVRPSLKTFLVAEADGQVVGSAGLELYGEAALVRSMAVAEPLRSSGLGLRLMEAITALAREKGARRLYLFTLTAEGFYRKFGFENVPLEAFEEAVGKSRQYQMVRSWWPHPGIVPMFRET